MISKHKILSNFGIFSWCSEGCLAGIRTWCDQHNWNEPIHYVFEAGTEGSGQFSQILQSLYKNEKTRTGNRIGGWSFENKSLQPLQAADVVAYEFFRFIRNEVVDKRKRKIRLSMQDLFRPPQDASLLKHFDKRAFENMVIRTDSGAMPE